MKRAEKIVQKGKGRKPVDGVAAGKAMKASDGAVKDKMKKKTAAATTAGRVRKGNTVKAVSAKKPLKFRRRTKFILGLLRNENRIFHGIAAIMEILINRK